MENDAPKMRDLMPDGYLNTLCKRCGTFNISNMSQVVRLENTASRAWPEVLKLAQETNPVGFAKWEAAHVEPA